MAESDIKYRKKLGEAYNEITRRSYYKNKEKRLKAIRERANKRKKTDVAFRLMELCRGRINDALRNNRKSAKSVVLIGCSWQELKAHLESKFTEGMSWDNYGKNGWQVDHIRPCASFDLSQESEQRKCFYFSNLQPLWGVDNKKKGSSYKNKRYASNVNSVG